MSYSLTSATDNSKLIYIDSSDATTVLSDDGSVFRYDLENAIQSPDTEDILISLYSCVIPYSFYNIRLNINNKLYFKRISNDNLYLFEIPAGNYTISSLGKVIQNALNNRSGDLSWASGTYSITYDRTNMKYRYYVTGIAESEIALDFSQLPDLAPYTELGFSKSTSFSIPVGVAGTPVDAEFSTNVPDVNGQIHQLQIRTTLCSKGCYDSITKSYSSILGSIPIDVNFGGIIFQNPRDNKHKILISTHTIKSITLRLTDDRGRGVNLNGLSFMVAIQIDTIVKKQKHKPMDRIERRIAENHIASLPPRKPKQVKVKKPKTKKELEKELLN